MDRWQMKNAFILNRKLIWILPSNYSSKWQLFKYQRWSDSLQYIQAQLKVLYGPKWCCAIRNISVNYGIMAFFTSLVHVFQFLFITVFV